MTNNTGNILLGILAGAAVGAGLGILFAPDKGANTRKKIKDGFDDVTENLKNRFKKGNIDLESKFEYFLSHTDSKREEVIDAMERKLGELKKEAATAKN
ncbi:MAG: YtxH domain-containing protein [Bacteroidota bacterium]